MYFNVLSSFTLYSAKSKRLDVWRGAIEVNFSIIIIISSSSSSSIISIIIIIITMIRCLQSAQVVL